MGGYIDKYYQGWLTGDLDMIQDACAEDFVYDDPVDGRFTTAQFPEYWKDLRGNGKWSDVVVQEADGVETGWCWWHWSPEVDSTGEGTQGASVMKADADGVHLTRLAYYTR
jgi:hypothetical protein